MQYYEMEFLRLNNFPYQVGVSSEEKTCRVATQQDVASLRWGDGKHDPRRKAEPEGLVPFVGDDHCLVLGQPRLARWEGHQGGVCCVFFLAEGIASIKSVEPLSD